MSDDDLRSPEPFNLPLEAADGHPFEDDGVSRRCALCGWWSSTHGEGVKVRLQDGEHVLPARATRQLGAEFIEEQTAFARDEGLIDP